MSKYNLHMSKNFAPVVTIDSEAGSVYIKLSENQISHTLPLKKRDVMANLHLDAEQKLVGLEIVGIREFNLERLIEASGLPLTQEMIDSAQYVKSDDLLRVQIFSTADPS